MPQELQTSLEDLVGIEYTKLGFFGEVQQKIQELKDSNLQLDQKRQEIQAILDGITDVMVVVDRELRVISVNHVYYQVYSVPEPEGKPCYKVFRGRDKPCPACPARVALHDERIVFEEAIYKVGATNRHFEIIASPLRDPRGIIDRVLLFKRDTTMEKEFRAKFYQAEKMATIGVLAAGVAHEINNPLTAISGFAEGLKRRLPRISGALEPDLFEDVQEYTQTILRECLRCQEIVKTLLSFSRPRSSEFQPIALNNLVQDTLKLLKHRLKEPGTCVMCLDLDDRLPFIPGDEPQLKQVILNLLTNALDATTSGDRVTIRTSMRDGYVSLAVEDTGSGIAQENLDKLFEPFFTTKPVGRGIGIGLSTCYNIVAQHRGDISVTSEPDKGSTFTVRLPLETHAQNPSPHS